VPETPEELWERVHEQLRVPPVHEWDTWPFDGDLSVRPLQPPLGQEAPRFGEGGVDCRRCAAADEDYLWTNEHWRLFAFEKPSGLPLVVLLETREHFGEPGDLPDELASELGLLVVRIERAIRSLGELGRVHVCRWGDGGEHLHWWFIARPARLPQLVGSFVAIWDDVLPPTPEGIWRTDLAALRAALDGVDG